MNNWKSKLTSRKFWAAVVGFVVPLLVAFGVPNLTIEQIVAVIGGAGVLCAYIVGEGLVDASHSTSTETKTDTLMPDAFKTPDQKSNDDK